MIRKHIRLYEDFEKADFKELTSETSGTWTDIRDTIQNLEPFVIINFKNERGYSKFLNDTDHEYIKQEHNNFNEEQQRMSPSLFIKSSLEFDKEDFKKYSILSVLTGKKEDDNIVVNTGNEEENTTLGNEIVDSIDRSDVFPEEHYKIGPVYYKFINFLS